MHIAPPDEQDKLRATTGKFLMGKRSAKVNKAGAWNLFGGRVDNGERPRQALVRELGEEAGLNIKPQHLAKLREDGLVATRRAGTTIHYRIADPRVARVMTTLHEIFCAEPA